MITTLRKGLMKEDTQVPNVTIRPKETHASTLHNIFGKMNHMPSYLKQKILGHEIIQWKHTFRVASDLYHTEEKYK